MQKLSFDALCEKYSDIKARVISREGKWGQLECTWKSNTDSNIPPYIKCINLDNCDVYKDYSKEILYKKFLKHTFFRPLHILYKTIYHIAFPISFSHIYYTAQTEANGDEEKLKKIFYERSLNSIKDIYNTLAYGLAMMVVSIAAVVFGYFQPSKLYDYREQMNGLIRGLYRVKETEYSRKDISQCLQNCRNLNIPPRDPFDDTLYPKDCTQVMRKIIHIARSEYYAAHSHSQISFCQTFLTSIT